jgi:glycosyltransferase involved in cell wall biosynthesis
LLVYGTHVADFVAAESGRREHVFVAQQSVDNERFRRPATAERLEVLQHQLSLEARPVGVFVGRLEPEKGLDLLLKASAAASVAHTLVLVGSGSLEPELRLLSVRLGIAERVRFAGHVSQGDLPAYLAVADFLVLPSVTTKRVKETWGLVVNEAMNCQLPVIATDAVGAAAGGLVVDGETGLVVPEGDVVALAGALDRLSSDTLLRLSLGQAASARVLDFSVSAAADAFEAAIAAAISARGRARRREVACAS